MAKKTTYDLKYSPNFETKKRSKKDIKFLIFHYTGMKNENSAIKKLTDQNSKVSCHYFIKNNGKIIQMVPDLYVAWHAGISNYKNIKFLNKLSIGVEIHNPGHDHGYKKFNDGQISSLKRLSKFIIKTYKIDKYKILGHSDISPNRKKDPGEKFPWKILAGDKIGYWHSLNGKKLRLFRSKKITKKENYKFFKVLKKLGYPIKYKSFTVKAFQRRFRQELINGLVDKECFNIAINLSLKLS